MRAPEADPRLRLTDVWLLALLGLALASWASFWTGRLFPLNDGALFLTYAERVAETFPALPACISFNQTCVPFGYPPAAFLAAGGLLRLGVEPIALMTLFPAAMSLFYAFAGLLVLRRGVRLWLGGGGRGDVAFLVAAAFFLLNHRSFEFLVMGGGMTRAAGAFCFALALHAALGQRERPRRRGPVLAGLWAGLALLCHLEWGLNALLLTVCLLARRVIWPNWRDAGVALLVAAVVMAPWIVWAIVHLGPDPFASAAATSYWSVWGGLARLLALEPLSEGAPLLIGAGLVLALGGGRFFWPAALMALLFLTPRHAATSWALPQAMLAAEAGAGIYLLAERHGRWAPRLGVLVAASLAVWMQLHLVQRSSAVTTLEQLSPDAIAASLWARDELPAGTAFVIVSAESWEIDQTAEWFPYVSGQPSRSTVQGTEWLGGMVFWDRIRFANGLNRARGCSGFLAALAARPREVRHILATARHDCLRDRERFAVLHRAGAVAIYRIQTHR